MSLGRGQSIAGAFETGVGESFSAVDPRDGSTLAGSFHEATADQIDRALEAAAAAHRQWRRAPRERRARLLEAIAAGLEGLGDTLIDRASAESGLPKARITGECGRTTGQLRLFATVVREGAYLQAHIDRVAQDLRRMEMPVGPVVVFGASNFPLAFSVAGGDTASALAAGCPVVAKAHPAHPGTSELVAEVIAKAVAEVEAPPGLFSCVQGRSHTVGERLVMHPAARAVGFTGSLAGGRALYALAAGRPEPIPVFAEMGSINPVVLLPGALERDAVGEAEGLFGSLTMGVGQFCTNPGLVLVLAGASTEAFLTKLTALATEAQPATMLHSGIAQAYTRGITSLAGAGAKALVDTAVVQSDHAAVRPVVWRVSATDLSTTEALREECFGPSTVVAVAEDQEQLLAAVQSLSGQLSATLHATEADQALVDTLLPELEERAGRVLFGGMPTGVAVVSAMQHGGPWPASSDARFTSVGTGAIARFTRPVCWQDAPAAQLPVELRDENPGIPRRVDGKPEA
ncbi:MAG: aldehyde dehydrogenase (NADP(+)) [Myxococcota bacterium]